MTVYVVYKQAVYRHEIGGVFDSLDGAKAHAMRLAEADKDTHHSYEVVPFELNEGIGGVEDWWDEPKSVFSCEKPAPPPEAGVRLCTRRPNKKPGWVIATQGARYRVRVDGVEIMGSIHAIDTIDGEVHHYKDWPSGYTITRGKVEFEEVPLTGAAP